MAESTDKTVIINTGVRELIFPLSAYGKSKVVDTRGALPAIESVRFMPGINIPMHKAIVGVARRPLTDAELEHVLKGENRRRLVETGVMVVTQDLTQNVNVSERAKLARTSADVVCLRAWLGQETNDKVKSEIQAQLAEIEQTRAEGDYRDVQTDRNADSASPGF